MAKQKLKSIGLKKRQMIYFSPLWWLIGLMVVGLLIFFKDGERLYLNLILGGCVVIFVVYFFYFKYKLYMPCPYCRKSVLIKDNWTCDYCNNDQGEIRFLNEKCVHCRRNLRTAFCEHCHKEFSL